MMRLGRVLDWLEVRERQVGPASAAEIAPTLSAKSKHAFFAVVPLLASCVAVFVTLLVARDHELLSHQGEGRLPLPLVGVKVPARLFIHVAPAVISVIYVFVLLQIRNLSRLLRRLGQVDPDTIDSHFLLPAPKKGYVLGYWGGVCVVIGPLTWLAVWWRLARFQQGLIQPPPLNDLPWATPSLLGYEFISFLAMVYLWLEHRLGTRWLASRGFVISDKGWSVRLALVMATACLLPIECSAAAPALDFRNAQISYFAGDKGTKPVAPSFRNAKLAGVRFDGAFVAGADFTGANLQRSTWNAANADGATFWHTNLRDAMFAGCHLNGADLMNAEVTDTSFAGADMTEARLAGLRGSGAFFLGTHLDGAAFFNANLPRVVFVGASMAKVDIEESQLLEADFRFAQLQGAGFGLARLPTLGAPAPFTLLTCADFSYARMENVGMEDVVIDGATFLRSHTTGMTIREALGARPPDVANPRCSNRPPLIPLSMQEPSAKESIHGRPVKTPPWVSDEEASVFCRLVIAVQARHWIQRNHITFVGDQSW